MLRLSYEKRVCLKFPGSYIEDLETKKRITVCDNSGKIAIQIESDTEERLWYLAFVCAC